MEIISREFIKDNAVFVTSVGTHNKEYLSKAVDYWKKVLIDNGAERGMTFGFISGISNIYYLAIVLASFELGLKHIILLKPLNEEDLSKPKFKLNMPLDILVWGMSDGNDFYFQHFKNNSKKVILTRDHIRLLGYNDISYNTDILATPKDILTSSVTSGSTGNYKVIDHTHKFFYDLCTKNCDSLEFQEDDIVLHIMQLQHGSSLGVFFLPSLHKSKTHYFHCDNTFTESTNDKDWDDFIYFCQKHKITKLFSPYNILNDLLYSAIERSSGVPDLTIMTITYLNSKWQKLVEENKLKKIVSIFGCTETSGPLFLPQISKETENFNPKFLGKPITNYHKIVVVDGNLTVTIPTYGTTIETEDLLEGDDLNGYTFCGKKKPYRLNDVEINDSEIIKILERNIENLPLEKILILVDEMHSKLYIVSDDENVIRFADKMKEGIKTYFNGKVILNDVIYIPNLISFIISVKPDKEKIIDYIRQIKNEQY